LRDEGGKGEKERRGRRVRSMRLWWQYERRKVMKKWEEEKAYREQGRQLFI